MRRRSFLCGMGVGVLAAVLVGGLVVAVDGSRTAVSPAAVPGSTAAPASAATPTGVIASEKTAAVPDLVGMTGDQASAALTAAGFTEVYISPPGAPRSSRVVVQAPLAGTQQRLSVFVVVSLSAADPATTAPPPPHRTLTAREWLLIAKDPDAHVGERIVVHGYVTQFDAATGAGVFRASVDGIRRGQTYQYPTNTMLRGTADQLRDVVTNDRFRAEVTVQGSVSYATQIGGSTTVPVLQIDSITVR